MLRFSNQVGFHEIYISTSLNNLNKMMHVFIYFFLVLILQFRGEKTNYT